MVGDGRLPPIPAVQPPLCRSLDHTKEVIVMESSRWSRVVTIAAVLMLTGIAAVVSYSHMYELALRHGEPQWRAALFPLSVDGMIVGASMTLLSDTETVEGRRHHAGQRLPRWGSTTSDRSPTAATPPMPHPQGNPPARSPRRSPPPISSRHN